MRGKFVRMIAVDKVAQARTFPSRYYRNRLARDRHTNGIPPVFRIFLNRQEPSPKGAALQSGGSVNCITAEFPRIR